MEKVLLTGARGFIGRSVAPELVAQNFEVHAVYHSGNPPRANSEVVWHSCDLFDPLAQLQLLEAVRPSLLLHLAWETTPGIYWTSPVNLRWVEASLALLRNFETTGGKRAVFAGSCAEYDWSYEECFESSTPMRPSTLYGQAKNSLNQILQTYCQLRSLSFAWGRIFFLYGPGEKTGRLVPSVVDTLSKGLRFECNQPAQVRDFLFINDVASAFVALLKSEVTGSVNIASGKPVALRVVVQQLGQLLQRESLLDFVSRQEARDCLVGNSQRLNSEVGFFPQYSLEAGLALTVEAAKQAGTF
jgi:nucleoside-diphosphate-sugar epimerase